MPLAEATNQIEGGGNLDVEASASLSYSGTSMSVCLGFEVSYWTMVGGVFPMTISGAIDACPSAEIKTYKAGYTASSGETSLTFETTPNLSTSFTLSVGVGNNDVSAGAYGSAVLIGFNDTLKSTINLKPSTGALTYSHTGVYSNSSLSGEAGVYAKAYFIKYNFPFIEWDGFNWNQVTLFSDSVPVASNVSATVEGYQATMSYDYVDSNGVSERGSTYVWKRASSATGTATEISGSNSSSYKLTEADANMYLQPCVTPSNGDKSGTQVCGNLVAVGQLARLWSGSGYSKTNVNIAYEKSTSGTCFNLSDFSFNDLLSSYKIYAPASYQVKYNFYKDANCTGTNTLSGTVAAGSSANNSSLGSANDQNASSVKFTFQETVSATTPDVVISENKATASYTFSAQDTESQSESGSTYQWYRASNASGSGSATISGATSKTYTLTPSDSDMFLRFCVTPSNGFSTGGQSCSGWKDVGHVVKLYKDSSYGGTSVAVAYQKSPSNTCFNLTSYSFNDALSSYKWATDTGSATLTFYKDINCSGSSTTSTAASNSSVSVSSMGSSWNDVVSSFKVSYTTTVSSSTPAVSFSGNLAVASYTFSDTSGKTESGSTYQWYRASTSSETGTAISGATSSSYALTSSDNNKFLRVCVTPSNGRMSGAQVCSSGKSVGNLISLYSDANLGGASVSFPYSPGGCSCGPNAEGYTTCEISAGSCYNLEDYTFSNVMSSYAFSGSNREVVFFSDKDCSSVLFKGTGSSSLSSSYDNKASSFYILPTSSACQ
jgi:hypothetical protein